MTKRYFSLLTALALVAGVLGALPARAQAITIPDVVQIDDPKGDANLLNDQDNAYGTPVAGEGDHVTPADVGSATDIMKVWFANTATDVSLNVQLEGNPGNLAYDTYFRFSSNAGEGPVANDTTRGCLQWVASVNGAGGAYTGETEGVLTDKCNVAGDPAVGPLTIAEGPDATFILTVTFPRSYSALLADGGTLTAPFGVSRVLYIGPTPQTATAVTMDNTQRGTDYTIVSDGPVLEPAPEPPGKADPPGKGKKKGCLKGKGKKLGACPGKKKPKPPRCPAYLPGEEGKDAPIAVVTDKATEEAPLELEFDAPPGRANDLGLGAYDGTASLYQNIQVDTKLPDGVGLYARYEFPDRHDYDLYLNYPDGSSAAVSGEANAVPGTGELGGGSPDGGWEAGSNFESVLGITTPDCGAYTARLVSYLTTGGATTLKLWLGEAKVAPAAPGGGESASEASSLDTFWSLMGL